MVGLAFLAFIAAYSVLWWFVVKKARNRSEKIAAILIAVLIPFGDLPIGYYKYKQYCSTEGGVRVFQPFPVQDKVFFDSFPSYSTDELLARGFKVVEVATSKGVARHEMGSNKQILTRMVSQPESPIRVSISRGQNLPWNIVGEERTARTQSDQKLLARYASYTWHGGWLQRSMSPLLRASLSCSTGPQDPIVELLRRGTESTRR